jgi:hypothetical protein
MDVVVWIAAAMGAVGAIVALAAIGALLGDWFMRRRRLKIAHRTGDVGHLTPWEFYRFVAEKQAKERKG